MVKRETFRLFCYTVGFLGMVILLTAETNSLIKWLGVILCVLFMVFGYAVTSKWARYVIGEQVEGEKPQGVQGSFGG